MYKVMTDFWFKRKLYTKGTEFPGEPTDELLVKGLVCADLVPEGKCSDGCQKGESPENSPPSDKVTSDNPTSVEPSSDEESEKSKKKKKKE
jgi:hypothetical protein